MKIKTLILVGVLCVLPQFAMAGSEPENEQTDTSATFVVPGSNTFTVPSYTTLTVEVWGAGGGGGGAGWRSDDNAGNGGNSSFGTPTPIVGKGGIKGRDRNNGGTGGAGGGYSGGDSGQNGTNGSTRSGECSGKGGKAGGSGGGAGGSAVCPTGGLLSGGYKADGHYGSIPGGGGSGGNQNNSNDGGGGGGGGYAKKTFTAGQLVPGSTINVLVGKGGAPGQGGDTGDIDGGGGGGGTVYISWTVNVNPTCTLNLSPNTINQGGSSTLLWSSSNATSFNITGVGPVDVPPGEGSVPVTPSATTVYTGTVTGPKGTSTCTATLTVNPATTADLVGNGEADDAITITEGATIPFSWSSSNASSCTLTHGDDAPWGGSTTGTTGTSRNVTFATNGTYLYTLTCTGAGGSTATDEVTVTVSYKTCSIANGIGAIIGGVCTLQSCNAGFHQDGNSCISNTRSCSIEHGTGQQTWDGSSWGLCTVLGCSVGYEKNNNSCIASLPEISSFSGDRVRRNAPSTLRWSISTVTDLTCAISPDPTDGTGTYVVTTTTGTVSTLPIIQTTLYTLSCTNSVGTVSLGATVSILPAFQEI